MKRVMKMGKKMRMGKLTKYRNIILSFINGVFLGLGVNYFFSYEVMTHPNSVVYFVSLALFVGSLIPLFFLPFSTQVWRRIRVILLGVTTISTIFAVFSFYQNLVWFLSEGYSTRVYVPVRSGTSKYIPLTVYPPDLIYNLLKAVFIASVSGFMERIIKIAENRSTRTH